VSQLTEDADRLGITSPFLSDPDSSVSEAYGVLRWAMPSGEPGHTFVLVDEDGVVRWVRDYGAPENGGLMYVEVDELYTELVDHL
jgi:peroxiredoxin